ncbi:MAG: hypothetical protein P4L81_06025, partial [Candidatus Pacebacteria bacterium]|nr:hypothetical protein [Candidatus Paceibacterota bacterium]
VADGDNALVFDHRDASGAALTRTLGKLMEAPDLCEALGIAAIRASMNFDVERVAQLFLADFAELTAGHKVFR